MIQKDLTKDSLDYASNKILKKLQDNYRSNSNSILLPSLAAFTLASCGGGGGGGGSSSYITPNGIPLAAASSTLTIDEDSSLNTLNISAPTDPDSDALSITINSVPAGGSLNKADGDLISSGNTLSVEDLTGLTFTPDANVSSDIVAMGSLSYTVTDTKGGSASSSVTISVNALQDPPTIDSDSTVSVDENNTVVLSVSGNDVDEDTLVYSISGGSDGDLFQIDSSSGELSFLNKADFEQPSDSDTNNQYEVEVTVDDSNGNMVSQNLVITVTDKDSIITLSNLSLDENSAGTNIGSLSSYIDDTSSTDTVSYSVSGTGSELFEVVEGELKLKVDSSADFEILSSYALTITATSGTANTAFDFNITINDVNDSPTAIDLSSIGVSEKIDGAVVGTISTADQDTGDTHTYAISDDRFEIIDGSLKLKAGNTVEYVTEPSIAITIKSTDSAGVEISQDFSILVGSIQLSSNEFGENSDGAIVGTLSITDPDFTSNVTYTLTGDDSDFFELVNNQLKLKDGNSADFETKATYNLTITADDDEANSSSLDYTINVTNVNEQPTSITLGSTSFNENSLSETIGVISTADDDSSDSHTYELSGADAESFEIVSSSLKLKDSISANYEVKNSYEITITSTDSGGLTASEDFSLTVNDINDAPSSLSLSASSVAENSSGTEVGTLSSTDEDTDDTFTYALSGTDKDFFELSGTTLKLKEASTADFETKSSYDVTITTTDAGGLSKAQDLTVNVTDVNDNPTAVALSSSSFDENTSGSDVGTLSSTDEDTDDTFTYALSGTDKDFFELSGTTLKLKEASTADFETKSSYDVTITTTDAGGLSKAQDLTVNVTDVNESPTDLGLSETAVAENTAGVEIGTISTTDPDADDTFTYTLSGDDADSFEVSGSSLKFKDSVSPNFENKSSYAINLTATDSGELTFEEAFTVTITDANDAPSAIEVSNLQTDENSIGALLDSIVITDEDAASETYSYEISGDDADSFEVVEGQLKVKSDVSLDYETKASYSITLTATDSTNLSISKDLTITATNLNDNDPIFTSASSFNLVENQNFVGTVTATDADGNSNLTYSISGGDDASLFSIDSSTGQLTLQSATSSITSTETPADQTIVVTVAGNAPGDYYLDGVLFADYQFTVGATYTFDLSDSSNSNHPLRFSETINGPFAGGSEYTSGVSYSGTAGQAGASTTITVTESTPQLYYYCAVHSGMGGQGLLTSQAFDNSLSVTLSNMIDNGNGTFTVDIQVSPSVDSFQALSSVSIWLSSGSSELAFSEDNVTISADGPTQQITTLDDGRVKLDWQDTTNSLESGTIGTLTFNAPSSSNNLPITVEGQLTGGTKDSSSATDGTLKSSVYNFSSGSSDVDYENPTDTGSDNTYNVVIQVSDGENSTTQAITVNVTNDTSDDSYGSISSISSTSLPSLDLDNSNIDFGKILPGISPVDGDFNISLLNINIMGFEGQINHQIESELSSFIRERDQSEEGKELEKIFTDKQLSLAVDDEVLDSLSHFSEIG